MAGQDRGSKERRRGMEGSDDVCSAEYEWVECRDDCGGEGRRVEAYRRVDEKEAGRKGGETGNIGDGGQDGF